MIVSSSGSKRYGGVLVEEGARIPQFLGDHLRFSIVSVCRSARPEQWVGEVCFNGVALATSAPAQDPQGASKEAQELLTSMLVELFRGLSADAGESQGR